MASLRMTVPSPSLVGSANASFVPETNATYFRSTAVRKQDDWSSDWLDDQTTIRMRSNFEAQMIRDERANQTGLLDAVERRNQSEAMRGMSKGALNELTSIYSKSQLNRLKGRANGLPTGVKSPLVATIFAASTVTGRELRYRPAHWMTIRSRSRIQGRTSVLTFQTPVFDTIVGYRDPGSDRTMSAQILTRLDQNWSTGFDTSYGGRFKVNYGIAF